MAGSLHGDTDEAQDFDDVDIVVTGGDLLAARNNMVPSLTLKDLDRYDALEAKYAVTKEAGAKVNSDKPVPEPAKKGGLGALPKRSKKGTDDVGTEALTAGASGSTTADDNVIRKQDESLGAPVNVMG
jgi:hypothetical protein